MEQGRLGRSRRFGSICAEYSRRKRPDAGRARPRSGPGRHRLCAINAAQALPLSAAVSIGIRRADGQAHGHPMSDPNLDVSAVEPDSADAAARPADRPAPRFVDADGAARWVKAPPVNDVNAPSTPKSWSSCGRWRRPCCRRANARAWPRWCASRLPICTPSSRGDTRASRSQRANATAVRARRRRCGGWPLPCHRPPILPDDCATPRPTLRRLGADPQVLDGYR
jgi:hypothetical protein